MATQEASGPDIPNLADLAETTLSKRTRNTLDNRGVPLRIALIAPDERLRELPMFGPTAMGELQELRTRVGLPATVEPGDWPEGVDPVTTTDDLTAVEQDPFPEIPETDEATQNRLGEIGDPVARLAEAGRTADEAFFQKDQARDFRDIAMAVLNLHRKDSGWRSKARVCRLAGLERDRWRYDAGLGRMAGVIKADYDSVDWDKVEERGGIDDQVRFYLEMREKTDEEVAAAVRAYAIKHREWSAVWRAATPVRDEVAYDLMEGVYGDPWPPAAIARTGQMFPQAVNRLRTTHRKEKVA